MDFSQFQIKALSKQDAALVKENPNASIDELMQLGLTDKGVTSLTAFQESIKPYKPKLTPKRVERVNKPLSNGKVRIENKRTGQTVEMEPKKAQRLLGKLNKSREMGKNYGTNYSKA